MRIHPNFTVLILAFLLASIAVFTAKVLAVNWSGFEMAAWGIVLPLGLAAMIRREDVFFAAIGLAGGTAFGLYLLPLVL